MTIISIFFAELPPALGWQAAASAAVGLAAAVAVWWIRSVLRSEDLEQGIEWRYDVSRINELRRVDSWKMKMFQQFARYQPTIDSAFFFFRK